MCLSWFPIFLDKFLDNFPVSFLLGKIDKIMGFLVRLLCSAFSLLFNFSKKKKKFLCLALIFTC